MALRRAKVAAIQLPSGIRTPSSTALLMGAAYIVCMGVAGHGVGRSAAIPISSASRRTAATTPRKEALVVCVDLRQEVVKPRAYSVVPDT